MLSPRYCHCFADSPNSYPEMSCRYGPKSPEKIPGDYRRKWLEFN